jgi:hypothetical protein
MFRSFAAAAVLVISSMAAMGCGSGLSAADAAIRCDQEKASKGQLFGTDTYAGCLSCFEECGDSCTAISTSPPTYTCPGDSASTTASSSTGQ